MDKTTATENEALSSDGAGASISASVVADKEEFVLVPPTDRKIPKVRIRTRQRKRLQGKRVVVVIDSWEVDSQFPNGHLVRIIGDANSWSTEIDALLMKHSIFQRPFSAAALACLPSVPNPKAMPSSMIIAMHGNEKGKKKHEWVDSGWEIPVGQIGANVRVDWRDSHRVFTVDPPGKEDDTIVHR